MSRKKSEICYDCRKKIVYLEVYKNKLKAFDVDHDSRIFVTHVCEILSDSVYTYSSGIIDSNRRKH